MQVVSVRAKGVQVVSVRANGRGFFYFPLFSTLSLCQCVLQFKICASAFSNFLGGAGRGPGVARARRWLGPTRVLALV